jgi:hypothetical protein
VCFLDRAVAGWAGALWPLFLAQAISLGRFIVPSFPGITFESQQNC